MGAHIRNIANGYLKSYETAASGDCRVYPQAGSDVIGSGHNSNLRSSCRDHSHVETRQLQMFLVSDSHHRSTREHTDFKRRVGTPLSHARGDPDLPLTVFDLNLPSPESVRESQMDLGQSTFDKHLNAYRP